MWCLDFITEQDFYTHVRNTIEHYGQKLQPYDLQKFNSNIVDPVKLVFDKIVYGYTWEETIKNEIFRQRDKSNTNDIGYFHQRIFSYMKSCVVPKTGWDVIVSREEGINVDECGTVSKIYVEMKNKHNTMNSASSAKTYMKMQGQLLADDDCACFLVEAIAKQSQNITWAVSVDGTKQKHRRIRRVSIDRFYHIVTNRRDAFFDVCMVLPTVVEDIVKHSEQIRIPRDTVLAELQEIAEDKNGSMALALYMLGFSSYWGFGKKG